MTFRIHVVSRAALLISLCGIGAATGCKDDDPCDPGQIEHNSQCYPAPSSGGGGSAGSAGSVTSDAAGAETSGGGDPGPGSEGLETPFGNECADTTGSTDCGGAAPVCADLAPLGQSTFCTQIDCAEGEANAGVCPDGFTCFAVPGYPSVCING
jgi:hypothetical protein